MAHDLKIYVYKLVLKKQKQQQQQNKKPKKQIKASDSLFWNVWCISY